MSQTSDFKERSKHDMTPEQREAILHVTSVGLQWVAGQISIDEVQQRLGKAHSVWHLSLDSYIYGMDGFSAVFDWQRDFEQEKKGISHDFKITIDPSIISRIPRNFFENHLNLVDGVSVKAGPHFSANILGAPPVSTVPDIVAWRNGVSWNYDLILPDDPPFDVAIGLEYVRVGHQTLENTDNLREVGIIRIYPNQEKRQKRDAEKKTKYDQTEFRTGMLCPQTGIWRSWGEHGPTQDVLVHAGDPFPRARLLPLKIDIASPHGNVRWVWLKRLEFPADWTPVH